MPPPTRSGHLIASPIPATYTHSPRTWHLEQLESESEPNTSPDAASDPASPSPYWLSTSSFVGPRLSAHLMRAKKPTAIGVKWQDRQGDEITNLEGALHTFVTPVVRAAMYGDYVYRAAGWGHDIDRFGQTGGDDGRGKEDKTVLGRLGSSLKKKTESGDGVRRLLMRPVIISGLVHLDFEYGNVMWEFLRADEETLTGLVEAAAAVLNEKGGTVVVLDDEIMSVGAKQDSRRRLDYDRRIRRDAWLGLLLRQHNDAATEATCATTTATTTTEDKEETELGPNKEKRKRPAKPKKKPKPKSPSDDIAHFAASFHDASAHLDIQEANELLSTAIASPDPGAVLAAVRYRWLHITDSGASRRRPGVNRDCISLHLLFLSVLHQVRNEHAALGRICGDDSDEDDDGGGAGYVYTYDPAVIFRRHLGLEGGELLTYILAGALRHLKANIPDFAARMRVFGYADFNNPIALPLLRQALRREATSSDPTSDQTGDVLVMSKDSLFKGKPGDLYTPPEQYRNCWLALHNNSDGFGNNVEFEEGSGSLDAIIGSWSSMAACLRRHEMALETGERYMSWDDGTLGLS